jgi:hypothetical protein
MMLRWLGCRVQLPLGGLRNSVTHHLATSHKAMSLSRQYIGLPSKIADQTNLKIAEEQIVATEKKNEIDIFTIGVRELTDCVQS